MRLIDADTLIERFSTRKDSWFDIDEVLEEISNTPDIEAESMRNALILMVLQYCTDDDGYLWNRCMVAGEAAFRVLGVKNGDSADELWARLEGEEKNATN